MWFWYAIGSALTSAVSIILNKKALKNINSSLVSWALFAFPIPFLIYPAFKDGWPEVNTLFWLAVIASVLTFTYAKTVALKSLKGSLMSEVVPLAFFSVFFQYIFGLIFFSESIKIIPIIGLILTVVGGYTLKVEEAREDFFKPFKLLFTNKNSLMYLIAMMMMAITTIFDKTGLINMKSTNQSFLLLVESTMSAIIIGIYMTKKNAKWLNDLRVNFWPLLLNGMIYLLLSLFWLYGITTGALALVSGVKKLEILFVLVVGWLFLGDKPKRGVWLGCLIMLLGVFFIKLG
ncbi:MAG: EamA family transporter [Patescibacteria group bacterium]|jgi:uncharacterized membrane protein